MQIYATKFRSSQKFELWDIEIFTSKSNWIYLFYLSTKLRFRHLIIRVVFRPKDDLQFKIDSFILSRKKLRWKIGNTLIDRIYVWDFCQIFWQPIKSIKNPKVPIIYWSTQPTSDAFIKLNTNCYISCSPLNVKYFKNISRCSINALWHEFKGWSNRVTRNLFFMFSHIMRILYFFTYLTLCTPELSKLVYLGDLGCKGLISVTNFS